MSQANKITTLNRLEIIMLSIMSSLKSSVGDYCDIETTDGRYNIVLNNGAIMTIIEYDGTRTIIGTEQFHQFITKLSSRLEVFLSKSGHQLGMVFRRDLNPTSDLYNISEIQKSTAKSLDLNLDFLIDESVEVYSRFVYDETNYLVLISFPNLLDSSEVSLEAKRKNQLTKQYNIPPFGESQNVLLVNSYLRSQHETYVEGVLSVLTTPEFAAQAQKLEVEEAIRSIKKGVSPYHTSDDWVPKIPRSKFDFKIPPRCKSSLIEDDVGHLLWESLPDQIMRSTISGVNGANADTYPVGSVLTENRIYAPLLIACPPQSFVSFNELFTGLNNASTILQSGEERALPYAISFMVSGDGMAGTGLKRSLAKILAVFNAENSHIKGAFESLSTFADNGGTVVKLSISAMTWAENNAYGIDEIQIRRSKLWRTLEAWGGAQVIEKGGDPILGFTSNIHGLSANHHAPKFAAPLWEALHFLPWCRQASPFSKGTVMHRSIDGKLMKQEIFSPELATWIKLYVGRPGSGKSVAMNNDILECCLMPGLKRLPLVFIIDVGVSSKGVVDLLQDHLPAEKRYLATYKRLQNDRRFAINPLDCAVGRMMPTPNETAQMVAFLSTLITPIEANGAAEVGLSNFLSTVVENLFISKMDGTEDGKPNIYEPNRDKELDRLLNELGIDPYKRSYFELVSMCHDKKNYRARDLCHRYAMPILTDMIAVVNSNPEIKSRYSNTVSESGGTFIEMLSRGISEAIRMYPVFADYTKFDVDQARVVSLDLQDVIGSNPKQSALFFQIARIFAKKRTAFTADDVDLFPENFRAYYKNLVEEISEDKKILCMDELHNAKRNPVLFEELKRDCREARKWGYLLKFASQLMEDFEDIPQMATQFVIADRGTNVSREYLKKTISLSSEELDALSKHVNLGPAGLTYLSKIVAKNASYVSLQTLTIGPQRLWALTTDSDDRLMRTTMYELLGDRPESLKLLAAVYPYGVRKAMNARKEQMRSTSENINPEDAMNTIARTMCKELIENREFIYSKLKKPSLQR